MVDTYESVQVRVRDACFELVESLIAAQNLGSYTHLLVAQEGDKTTMFLYGGGKILETTEAVGRLTRGNP